MFFINLDKSTDRRQSLERDFAALPGYVPSGLQLHRVPAETTADVESMLEQDFLVLNEGLHLTKNSERGKAKGEYTFKEAACTLSHLKAIREAYNGGHDMVMIIEDDVSLTSQFFENWMAYAEQAPKDWHILQWATSNEAVNKRELYKSNDLWISWKPYYYGAFAYSIRREGMQLILDHAYEESSSNGTASDRWKFLEPDILVADELVYYLAQNTYTSTFPWIVLEEFASTLGNSHNIATNNALEFGDSTLAVPKLEALERPERIAVVTSYRLTDKDSIVKEIQRIKADIDALSKFHSSYRWFINVVLVHKDLRSFFEDKRSDLPSDFIDFRIQISSKCFNKFVFVNDVLNDVVHYDYVLLKDGDINIAGFEWNVFMNAKGDSIIAGPFRETTEELMYRARFNLLSQESTLQSGGIFNTYKDESFAAKPSVISTMFLEQSFALIRSDFALWYFRQVLTDFFLEQETDWGVDMMWCGAAYGFQDFDENAFSSSPCSLVPANILHKDTKQIARSSGLGDYSMKGHRVVDRFRENARFSSWIDASFILSPSHKLDTVLGWCRRRQLPYKMKSKCGIARAQSAVGGVDASILSSPQGSVQATIRQSNVFHIQELVHGKQNVALYRHASQSSTFIHEKKYGVASSAVDGNLDPNFKIGSVTSTGW